MIKIGAIELKNVQSEAQTKDSGIFNQALPMKDSDAQILKDLLGTTKSVTLTGIATGTKAELKAFIWSFESLQNGNQSSLTYENDLSFGTIQVLISSFAWDWVKANPNSISYTIQLMQGRVI